MVREEEFSGVLLGGSSYFYIFEYPDSKEQEVVEVLV